MAVTEYIEETHKYYVDGEEKPSVTEICEPISFKRMASIPQQILENARNRGSACHALFEDYLLVGEVDLDEIKSDYVPYVEQFIMWARTYRPKVLYTEKHLFGSEFCGTCDLICRIDGKTLLVDYKTTSAADKKSLSVQLEGYYRLCKENGIDIDECWYLHLKKDTFVFKQINRDCEWFDLLLKHNKKMKEKYNDGKYGNS